MSVAEGDRCRCRGCSSRRKRTSTREKGAVHCAIGRRPVHSRGRPRRRAIGVGEFVKEGEGMSDIISVCHITSCHHGSHDIIPCTTCGQTLPSDVMVNMAESRIIAHGCHGSSCGVAADHRAALQSKRHFADTRNNIRSSPANDSAFSDTSNHDNVSVLDA